MSATSFIHNRIEDQSTQTFQNMDENIDSNGADVQHFSFDNANIVDHCKNDQDMRDGKHQHDVGKHGYVIKGLFNENPDKYYNVLGDGVTKPTTDDSMIY